MFNRFDTEKIFYLSLILPIIFYLRTNLLQELICYDIPKSLFSFYMKRLLFNNSSTIVLLDLYLAWEINIQFYLLKWVGFHYKLAC